LRVAVSGSHGAGKSTLIAAFLRRHPEYVHEPEAFEILADDIDLTESGAPTPDGLHTLLEYTASALQGHSAEAHVMFERSPLDYLAYAAASGSAWPPGEKRAFLATHTPFVRTSIRNLDLVAYLPLADDRWIER
jgi:predicted ATPase